MLIERGFRETYAPPLTAAVRLDNLLADARKLRADIGARAESRDLMVDKDAEMIPRIAQLTKIARDWHLSEMSNRRIIKFARLMLIHALLRASASGQAPQVGEDDLRIIWAFGFDRPADRPDFKRLLGMTP